MRGVADGIGDVVLRDREARIGRHVIRIQQIGLAIGFEGAPIAVEGPAVAKLPGEQVLVVCLEVRSTMRCCILRGRQLELQGGDDRAGNLVLDLEYVLPFAPKRAKLL